MYSMAQQAVANGYGKMEYLRAQPIARSSRVTTTLSERSISSPEVTDRDGRAGRGGSAFAMRPSLGISAAFRPVKATRRICNRTTCRLARARDDPLHPPARHGDVL